MAYTVGSLFSGALDGLGLAFSIAGYEVLFHVEFDDWRRKVLEKHAPQFWPHSIQHKDVKQVGAGNLPYVDCLVGGFPCQDVSHAGQRAGLDEGTRSGLWYEFRRIISELRPRVVIVENVTGLLTLGGSTVIADLAGLGYVGRWGVISASDAGATHTRKRIFIVAYTSESGRRGRGDYQPERHLLHDLDRTPAQGEPQRDGWQRGAGATDSNVADTDEAGRQERQLATVTNGMGHPTRRDATAMGYASEAGLSQRGYTRRNKGNPKSRAGMVAKLERPSVAGIGRKTGATQSRIRGNADGLSSRMDFPGFPARPNESQYAYEPPRTLPGKAVKDRKRRLEALGDGVVWQCVYPIAVSVKQLLTAQDAERVA